MGEKTATRAKAAERIWRCFLLDELPHPGEFRQHVVPLDEISSATSDLAPSINRHFMRAIHLDIVSGARISFTYSKLGRWAIFGSIEEPKGTWRGTKINANGGSVGPSTFALPSQLIDYWNEKARKMTASMVDVSDRQHAKIASAFHKNLDRYVGSDAFAAMKADVNMFGSAAFISRGTLGSDAERTSDGEVPPNPEPP